MSTFFIFRVRNLANEGAVPPPRRFAAPSTIPRRVLRSHTFLALPLFALAAALAFPSSSVAAKATPPPAANANDSKPVLMSRTGGAGGSAWTDVKELQAAAAKGNPKAQAHLGEILLRGDGIAQDDARAVDLLEKAARAGHSGAAFRLGMLLSNGEHGVAQDHARALAYFRAAAAGGEKEAFFNIGAAYGSAKGVKRDYGEALGWLIVARQHGADASAEQQLRQRIKGQPSWIAKGERRAKEIAQEFAGKKVADLLPPPAPLDAPAVAPASDLRPSESSNAATPDLRPANTLPRPEVPKPSLPALPPPAIKP